MKSCIYGLILVICVTCFESRPVESNDDSVGKLVHSSREMSNYDNGDAFGSAEDTWHGNKLLQKRIKRRCPAAGLWRKCKVQDDVLGEEFYRETRADAERQEERIRALLVKYKKEHSRWRRASIY